MLHLRNAALQASAIAAYLQTAPVLAFMQDELA
jgi:hypothetical protein